MKEWGNMSKRREMEGKREKEIIVGQKRKRDKIDCSRERNKGKGGEKGDGWREREENGGREGRGEEREH